MSLLWLRPPHAEAKLLPEERRVRDFLDTPAGVSETVASLSAKLGVQRDRCRSVLEQLTREGILRRRDFDDMPPIYCRYPNR